MNLSISNLAWKYKEDEAVKDILHELSVRAIEVAPTKIWENPFQATEKAVNQYREYWNSNGVRIAALQSLLFGRPDLVIFSDKQKRMETIEYLGKIIEIGFELGAKAFVFGSPKNRLVGGMNRTQAMDIAIDFFHHLGEKANQFNTVFCIEPNPKDYGCDFITNTEEGIELVKEVNHAGFGLHLDAGGMTLGKENIEASVEKAAQYLTHFHISEPHLNMIQQGQVNHKLFAKVLKEIHYEGYISIEMKPGLNDSDLITVRKSLEIVQDIYL
ncbi:sugar phosphate isomerase/epimerase family protein [Neobacillus sp. OS1-2]|uniref:sugar phosphate isomerase/epimerase family protein n=1 Tax=Neobacillus sp. OS1-2 TaxID=3070680 RepID=UPI0027DF5E51|nr:sugar phosphate isomerase/epimerase family protein [Neobacillus sp. OS1-2]WML41236.1 sugar phosphate isomerase/epimerase family protein [Neobacillus sp. OS1-2]